MKGGSLFEMNGGVPLDFLILKKGDFKTKGLIIC